MRQLSIGEIHERMLEMMSDIHHFCEENEIRYSLAYGSLIGAIRHNGFIPWDDDIDIWMPRPDFEKFCQLYRNREDVRIGSIYDDNIYSVITRVYDTKKTFIDFSKLKRCEFDTGVWIDIMPIDGAPKVDEFAKFYKKIRRNIYFYNVFRPVVYENKIRFVLKFLIRCYASVLYNGFDGCRKKFIELCTNYKFGESDICSNYTCYSAYKTGKLEYFRTSSFNEYELHKFENLELYIIKDYDNVLTSIYGDYMIIPPKEKQIVHGEIVFSKE